VSIGQNFTGYTSSNNNNPAPSGAASEDYVVEFNSEQFAVHSKVDGSVLQSMDTVGFWTQAGVSLYPNTCWAGPRVVYDPTVQRWFVAQALGNCVSDATAQLRLAVSASADPTGAWNGVTLPEKPGNSSSGLLTVFLGLDAHGLYLSSEVWPTNTSIAIPTGTELWSLSKQELLAIPPIINNRTSFGQLLTTNYGYSLAPALAFDGSAGGNVLGPDSAGVDAGGNPVTNNSLVAFAIENALGPGPATLTPTQALLVLPYTEPINYAQQPDGSANLVDGDAEFASQVYRVGDVLLAAQGIQLGPRVAVRWYRVNATNQRLLEVGTITDPNLDFYFPSIAANTNGTVVLAFNGSGSNTSVSCYAVAGQTVNGVTTFGNPLLLQAGAASYQNPPPGSPYSNWGLYSTTCVDPTDPNVFWTINAYAADPTTWATQITQLRTSPSPQLSIGKSGSNLVLSWPVTTVPFQLESTQDLGASASWLPVTPAGTTNGATVSATVSVSGPTTFFRLIAAP
jgi:hypothetical protein